MPCGTLRSATQTGSLSISEKKKKLHRKLGSESSADIAEISKVFMNRAETMQRLCRDYAETLHPTNPVDTYLHEQNA